MYSLLSGNNYHRKRDEYMKENAPSFVSGCMSCSRCATCCWTRPPRLTQEELKNLASKFSMTEREFFQKYCVVDDPGSSDDTPVLIRKHQDYLAGEYLPCDETYSFESPCVFLSEKDGVKSCELQDCKPVECSSHRCWDGSSVSVRYDWTSNELEKLGYNGHDLQ